MSYGLSRRVQRKENQPSRFFPQNVVDIGIMIGRIDDML